MNRMLTSRINSYLSQNLPNSESLSFKITEFDSTTGKTVAEVLVGEKVSDNNYKYTTKIVEFTTDMSMSDVKVSTSTNVPSLDIPTKIERYRINPLIAFNGTKIEGSNVSLPVTPILGSSVVHSGDALFACKVGDPATEYYVTVPSTDIASVVTAVKAEDKTLFSLGTYYVYAYQVDAEHNKFHRNGYEITLDAGSWVLYPLGSLFFNESVAVYLSDKAFKDLFIDIHTKVEPAKVDAPSQETSTNNN